MTDRALAVKLLAARCEAEPGTVLSELLGRLRARSDDLLRALRGEPMRVELLHGGETWLVFTALGHVTAVRDKALLGCDQRPHVLLHGDPEAVLRMAVGLLPLEAAVERGVFIPLVPVARFKRVQRLVAQELLALAEAS